MYRRKIMNKKKTHKKTKLSIFPFRLSCIKVPKIKDFQFYFEKRNYLSLIEMIEQRTDLIFPIILGTPYSRLKSDSRV